MLNIACEGTPVPDQNQAFADGVDISWMKFRLPSRWGATVKLRICILSRSKTIMPTGRWHYTPPFIQQSFTMARNA